jgi:glycosyltransferase involved in cell wall biosynthesis
MLSSRPIRFLWVGGSALGLEAQQFAYDVERLGLQQLCRHVPSTPEVLEYYHAMDVFALSSREDPFPLVMLEAGIRGLPTVCFSDAGGGSEFVGEHAGIVAPESPRASRAAAGSARLHHRTTVAETDGQHREEHQVRHTRTPSGNESGSAACLTSS